MTFGGQVRHEQYADRVILSACGVLSVDQGAAEMAKARADEAAGDRKPRNVKLAYSSPTLVALGTVVALTGAKPGSVSEGATKKAGGT